MVDPPTHREVRLSAVILAACALLLSGSLAYGIVHKVNQSDSIVRTAAAEADQVERLSSQLDAQAKTDAARQAAIEAHDHTVQAQLTALLAYLRAHGVTVPSIAFTSPPSVVTTPPKVPGSPPPPPRHVPSPSPSSTPTATSLADLTWLCALLGLPICPRL